MLNTAVLKVVLVLCACAFAFAAAVCSLKRFFFMYPNPKKVGDVVGCLLDVDGAAGTASMSFSLNGKDMGAAFDCVRLAPAAERDATSGGGGGGALGVRIISPGKGGGQKAKRRCICVHMYNRHSKS